MIGIIFFVRATTYGWGCCRSAVNMTLKVSCSFFSSLVKSCPFNGLDQVAAIANALTTGANIAILGE